MSKENHYTVNVSTFALTELSRREDQVKRGQRLLSSKVETLKRKARDLSNEFFLLNQKIIPVFSEAFIKLAAARFVNDPFKAMVVENVEEATVKVVEKRENFYGVITKNFIVDSVDRTDDLIGLSAGAQRIREAKFSFDKAVLLLVRIASLRNMLVALLDAIRTENMKVNRLEKVIMPKIVNTKKYIMEEIDEKERDDYYRLKMAKKKQRLKRLLKMQL